MASFPIEGCRWQSIVPSLVTTLVVQLVLQNPIAAADPYVKTPAVLPEFMADFEVNYNNGDIAAVSPVKNKAYLFRYEDVATAITDVPPWNITLAPSKEVEVCTTPHSISYKRYQDQQDVVHDYYGIVCAQVDKLFILDATSFSVLSEATIGGLASNIFSSRNQSDPFFYYSYIMPNVGGNVGGKFAAFDVRSKEDRGDVSNRNSYYEASHDAAMSADGQLMYGYRRSLELSSTDVWYEEDSTPSFRQIFIEYDAKDTIVPDTMNQRTASGRVVYSKTLESQIANLDFNVVCWGSSSSYIFGFEKQGSYYNSKITGISAVSSETYQTVGREVVKLPNEFSIPNDKLPVISQGTQSHQVFQQHLIADDLHSQLVVVYANLLSIIPYKCFYSSPFGPNATELFIGVGSQHIRVANDQEENLFSGDEMVSLIELPEGAIFDSSSRLLTWDPSPEQIGYHKLFVLVSSDSQDCYYNMTLQVSYPSISVPFKVNNGGISIVDESKGLVVLWENDHESYSSWGQSTSSSVALARFHDQPQLILTKHFDFSIQHILATSAHIVVVKTKGSNELYQTFLIFGLQMTSSDSFVINGQTYGQTYGSYSSMTIVDGVFRIRGKQMEKTVDLNTLESNERELLYGSTIQPSYTSDGSSFSMPMSDPIRDGVIKDGILYNPISGEPAVLVDKGPFSLDSNAEQTSRYSRVPSWLTVIPKYIDDDEKINVLYESGIALQTQLVLETDSSGNRWTEVLIHVLDLGGKFLGTKKVLAIPYTNDYSYSGTPKVLMAAGQNHVYLVLSNNTYSFNHCDFDFPSLSSTPVSKSTLRFTSNQTSFCAQGDRDVELHHTVLGGKGPIDLFGKVSLPSLLQIDTATGSITLNGTEFMAEAREALVKHYTTEDEAGGLAGLLAASRKASDPLFHIEDCLKPNEIPVSKEISMEAVDQQGEMASLVYYVFIGVPYDDVAPLVKDWKQSAITTLSPTVGPPSSCDCSACPTIRYEPKTITAGPVKIEQPINVSTDVALVGCSNQKANKTLTAKDATNKQNESSPIQTGGSLKEATSSGLAIACSAFVTSLASSVLFFAGWHITLI